MRLLGRRVLESHRCGASCVHLVSTDSDSLPTYAFRQYWGRAQHRKNGSFLVAVWEEGLNLLSFSSMSLSLLKPPSLSRNTQ